MNAPNLAADHAGAAGTSAGAMRASGTLTQGGQFYRKSPTGQMFFKYFGESIFRNDLCNADV